MKTSEFKKQVNALGYTTHNDVLNGLLYISNGGRYLAVINLIEQYNFDIDLCTKKEMHDLYNLIGIYVRTPIHDRKEQKKYRLKHKFLNRNREEFEQNENSDENYLSLDAYGYYLSSDTDKKDSDVQTEFTQEEIDYLPFKITDDQWEREEV